MSSTLYKSSNIETVSLSFPSPFLNVNFFEYHIFYIEILNPFCENNALYVDIFYKQHLSLITYFWSHLYRRIHLDIFQKIWVNSFSCILILYFKYKAFNLMVLVTDNHIKLCSTLYVNLIVFHLLSSFLRLINTLFFPSKHFCCFSPWFLFIGNDKKWNTQKVQGSIKLKLWHFLGTLLNGRPQIISRE